MAQSSSFLFRIRFRPVKTGAQFEKVSICFLRLARKQTIGFFVFRVAQRSTGLAEANAKNMKGNKTEKARRRRALPGFSLMSYFPVCREEKEHARHLTSAPGHAHRPPAFCLYIPAPLQKA